MSASTQKYYDPVGKWYNLTDLGNENMSLIFSELDNAGVIFVSLSWTNYDDDVDNHFGSVEGREDIRKFCCEERADYVPYIDSMTIKCYLDGELYEFLFDFSKSSIGIFQRPGNPKNLSCIPMNLESKITEQRNTKKA